MGPGEDSADPDDVGGGDINSAAESLAPSVMGSKPVESIPRSEVSSSTPGLGSPALDTTVSLAGAIVSIIP
jgi:hypothetical protein